MAYPYPYSQAARLDRRITLPRPPIDPALAPLLDSFLLPEAFDLALMRQYAAAVPCTAMTVLQSALGWTHAEHIVAGDGDDVLLSVFRNKTSDKRDADITPLYYMHGGGMVSGDRFTGVSELLPLLPDTACVVVTVEYRLAPETRAPGAAEDCYRGLAWLTTQGPQILGTTASVLVCGVSGGGGLAAAVCLMARDRGLTPAPRGQMLLAPMLDDRGTSVSARQFALGCPWSGQWDAAAWRLVLGAEEHDDTYTPYQVPARATDLSHLPPAYLDVGACDVLRDATVQYASDLWRDGGACELHVWPGAFHLFDAVDQPGIAVVHAAVEAKRTWLRQML